MILINFKIETRLLPKRKPYLLYQLTPLFIAVNDYDKITAERL